MTRPYFQVHGANTLARAKWRKTPLGTRGVLLTLWMLSSVRDPEGHWPDRQTLEADLAADAGVEDLKSAVDRLIELKWLDCTPSGCIVHDWPDWQPDLPKTHAERQADYRSRHASDASDVTRHSNGARNETRNGARDGALLLPKTPAERQAAFRARHARNESNAGDGSDASDGVTSLVTLGKEMNQRTGSSLRSEPARKGKPSPRQTVLAWMTEHKIAQPVGYVNANLNELIKAFGAPKIIKALDADKASKTVKQYVAALERELAPTSRGSPKAGSGATRPASEIDHAFD